MLALINDTGILVVVILAVLLLGTSQIPKLARSLGEAGREFRKAHDETTGTGHTSTTEPAQLGHPAQPGEPAALREPAAADQPGTGEDQVTLTRAQFDVLIASRPAPGRPAEPTGTSSHPNPAA